MTAPTVVTDDREKIRAHAQAMADAGRPQAEIEAFVQEAMSAVTRADGPKLRGGGTERTFEAPATGGGAPISAHVLNALQTAVPFGGEMLEAGAGALGSRFTDHPMSYAQSLNALREETDKIPNIPMYVGGANAMAPGIKTLERIPGMVYSGVRSGANTLLNAVSPAKAGAILGAGAGATKADPMSAMERLKNAASGAVWGAVIGKATEVGGSALRGKASRTPGDLAVDVAERNRALDDADYAPVHAELASGGGTSPAVMRALKDPRIARYADRVRSSPLYHEATDAEVLVKAKELISDVQRRAELGMVAADNDIANGTRLSAEEAAFLKQKIRDAVTTETPEFPAVAPSLPAADIAKAARESAREAGETASDIARRVVKGPGKGTQAARKLATKSPEAFLRTDIPQMNEAELEAANAAIVARLKENSSLFHPIRSIEANVRLAPYLRATRSSGQRAMDLLVRALTQAGANRRPF